MEFNEKLQELRKQKGITQQELADLLFVSRTAVSKWESGRGYPSIESLRLIAKTFSITVDSLLSSDEALTLAEENERKKENHFRDMIFGLFDLSIIILLFLPIFANREDGTLYTSNLISLQNVQIYLKTLYFTFIICTSILGIVTLALQCVQIPLWIKIKGKLSLILNLALALLFIVSLQPYPAIFVIMMLVIKVILVAKR